MTFRQPLVHRWRQQKPRLAVYLAKVAHPPTTAGIPSLQSYHIMRHLPPKSDRLLGRKQELAHEPSHFIGPLEMRQVACIVDQREPGAGDPLREVVGIGRRDQLIRFSPEDESRRTDPVYP